MWIYEKRLQFPVNIRAKNPRLAKAIVSQLGGPDGELAASMRYFAQRYAMPDRRVAGFSTTWPQRNWRTWKWWARSFASSPAGFPPTNSRQHGLTTIMSITPAAVWMQSASGAPFTAAYFQSKGDPVTDLHEAMPPNRRPAPPTTISSASPTIQTFWRPSAFCAARGGSLPALRRGPAPGDRGARQAQSVRAQPRLRRLSPWRGAARP